MNDVTSIVERPVALITGTSRGIGNRLALHFLELDYQVVGCSRAAYHDFDHLDYRHEIVDVGVESDVVKMFQGLRRDFGRLDVAVNNAWSYEPPARVAMTSAASTMRVLSSGVTGAFVVCREATRMMMRQRSGRIINIGSMATSRPIEGGAVYRAAKAAINAMTEVHAREVARYGITCNVVAPASADTDFMRSLPPGKAEELLAQNAQHWVGNGGDVAELVDWLVSPAGAAVTGQVIYLGGA